MKSETIALLVALCLLSLIGIVYLYLWVTLPQGPVVCTDRRTGVVIDCPPMVTGIFPLNKSNLPGAYIDEHINISMLLRVMG